MKLRSYLIDCVTMIFSAGTFVSYSVRSQYIYQVVSEAHNFTANKSTEYCTSNSTSTKQGDIVADEASTWQLYCSLSYGIPAIFASVFLVPWSDKIGRRIALFFPLIASSLSSTMLIFIVKYSLPPYMIVICSGIEGIGGSYITLLNICMAFVSDIATNKDEKLYRFTLLECGLGLGGGLATFLCGYWITASGFFPSTCLAACLIWFAILLLPFLPNIKKSRKISFTTYGTINAPSSSEEDSEVLIRQAEGLPPHHVQSFCERMKLIWKVYSTNESICNVCNLDAKDYTSTLCLHGGGIRKGRVWRLWFYLISFNVFVLPPLGLGMIDVMYFASYPLCFSPTYLGIRTAIDFAAVAISPLLILLFKRAMKLNNGTILAISIPVSMFVFVALGLVKVASLVFIINVLYCFGHTTTPVMRAQMSSLASSSEQGAVFGLVSGTESFTNMLATVSYVLIYPATLGIYHGFIFLFSGGLCIIPLFLMIFIWIADNRRIAHGHNIDSDLSPLLSS